MIWCLLGPAALLAALGLLALTLDLRALRPPRVSPSRALRGCMSGTLLMIAGCLAALAALVQGWQP